MKSALDRAASTAKVKLEQLADGSLRITTERAGRNGFQAIEKVVDASGTTKSVVQKGFDAAGNLVHVGELVHWTLDDWTVAYTSCDNGNSRDTIETQTNTPYQSQQFDANCSYGW